MGREGNKVAKKTPMEPRCGRGVLLDVEDFNEKS